METLTLLVCHICLYLKPFPPYNSFAEREKEHLKNTVKGETAGKCDSTENVYPAPTTTTTTTTRIQQLRSVYEAGERERERGGGGRGGMVLLDPRGRQRWKECAVQPVNTLTQRGKKTSYKQKLSHHPEPPPPAVYTCREGGREEEEEE